MPTPRFCMTTRTVTTTTAAAASVAAAVDHYLLRCRFMWRSSSSVVTIMKRNYSVGTDLVSQRTTKTTMISSPSKRLSLMGFHHHQTIRRTRSSFVPLDVPSERHNVDDFHWSSFEQQQQQRRNRQHASNNDDNNHDDNKLRIDQPEMVKKSVMDSKATVPTVATTTTTSNLVNGTTTITKTTTTTSQQHFPCGRTLHEDDDELPPPLPEPVYSVHKRVLPSSLTAFSSPDGKRLLIESFANETAESYWKLMEQFVNQSDPAFCGVTTLVMCLNAMSIDPDVRWRGGWRFYGNEDVLLDRCCQSTEKIRRSGITMEDFFRLGRCHGLTIQLKRPMIVQQQEQQQQEQEQQHSDDGMRAGQLIQSQSGTEGYSIDDFRNDIRSILSDTSNRQPLLVTSFSRKGLGQTGDGHFSPIAAYHEGTDQVLVLDVARFKYSPFWVPVQDLYRSMEEIDSVTAKPRGWFVLHPPPNKKQQQQQQKGESQEDRRPAELVPIVGEGNICPVGPIKIRFCKSNPSSYER